MSVGAAIDHIASEYDGWGKKYTNSRPEWIARLKIWEKDHKKERQAWTSVHHAQTQLWKAKYNNTKGEKRANDSDLSGSTPKKLRI